MKESGDLIIIKDVMQHWPNKEVSYFLETVLPRFKYGLLTNDMTGGEQVDITFGGWRALNFGSLTNKEFLYKFNLVNKQTYIFPGLPKGYRKGGVEMGVGA